MRKSFHDIDAIALKSEVFIAELQAENLARENDTPSPYCIYCGFPATHRDHVIPVSRQGGGDRRWLKFAGPIVDSCTSCNCKLQNRFYPTFRARIEAIHEWLRLRVLQRANWEDSEMEGLSACMAQVVNAHRLETRQLAARAWWARKILSRTGGGGIGHRKGDGTSGRWGQR
jgi:hypothetical protein